ncbi:MBL fold metallo-hydrolase [Verrucomicrobiota bacterium]
MLELCVLASGSRGNCIYVGGKKTKLIIDAGLSAKQIKLRLEEIKVDADMLDALCISHDHTDHIQGARVMHRKHKLALYSNGGTLEGIYRADERNRELPWKVFSTGHPFQVGEFTIEPFSVPHDALEPVGFIIKSDHGTVGVATDLGVVTNLIREKLRHCEALVLETNHCPKMLQNADRPWFLKQRIAGRQGHLSNPAAGELAIELAKAGNLKHLFLAHLSSDCNDPKVAMHSIKSALKKADCDHINVEMTHQNQISNLWRTEN